MPAYATWPNSKSVYPGQSALLIGNPGNYSGGSPGPGNATAEAVATGYKSIPVCIAQGMTGIGNTDRQINWRVHYGVAPSAITWQLQGAIDDIEADYVQVDTSSTITDFTQTKASNFKFFRLYASSVTGPCTVAARISCM